MKKEKTLAGGRVGLTNLLMSDEEREDTNREEGGADELANE